MPERDLFDRDWLVNKFNEVAEELENEEQIRVSKSGVRVVPGPSDEMIKEKLLGYIDWPYAECELYKKGGEGD